MLNDIGLAYASATAGWLQILLPITQRLFLSLATIELVWSGIWWALASRQEDFVLVPILRKVVQLMFFYTLLLFAPVWIPTIIGSFAQAGGLASGFQTLDPSAVFQQGLEIAVRMVLKVATSLPIGNATIFIQIPALLFLISFAVIAGILLITLIESYLVIGGGILLLGFGGSRWTATFAEGYLLYAMRVGVKLFVLYLLIGVGMTLPPIWLSDLGLFDYFDLRLQLELMGAALIFAMIVHQVPRLAADMVGSRTTFHMDRAYAES